MLRKSNCEEMASLALRESGIVREVYGTFLLIHTDPVFWRGCSSRVRKPQGVEGSHRFRRPALRRQLRLDDAENDLKSAGLRLLTMSVSVDPSVRDRYERLRMASSSSQTWIIAIGGGSPINAAKATWIKYEYQEPHLRTWLRSLVS